jgi:hypothetical protein
MEESSSKKKLFNALHNVKREARGAKKREKERKEKR